MTSLCLIGKPLLGTILLMAVCSLWKVPMVCHTTSLLLLLHLLLMLPIVLLSGIELPVFPDLAGKVYLDTVYRRVIIEKHSMITRFFYIYSS